MVEHEGWPKVSKMQGIFVKMMVLACCLPVVKVERIMKPPAVHDPLKSDSRSLDFGFRGIFVASLASMGKPLPDLWRRKRGRVDGRTVSRTFARNLPRDFMVNDPSRFYIGGRAAATGCGDCGVSESVAARLRLTLAREIL